jgi:hypothetical protein
VAGPHSKSYASCDRRIAVAILAEHRGYSFEIAEVRRERRPELKEYRPAVDVKQKASPARHEDPTVPSTPVSGRESKRPIDDQAVEMWAIQYKSIWLRRLRQLHCGRSRTSSHAPSPCPIPSPPRGTAARHVFPRTLAMSESQPPPPGIYVPAVLFLKENEDIDEEALISHVIHLAQVHTLEFLLHYCTLALTAASTLLSAGICYRDTCPGLERRSAASLKRRAETCHSSDSGCP